MARTLLALLAGFEFLDEFFLAYYRLCRAVIALKSLRYSVANAVRVRMGASSSVYPFEQASFHPFA